jgi:dTDP-4-dehydrorhamnose reductase
MTRYLVTGVSGLLGANFALEAVRAGHTVTGIANRNGLNGAPFKVLRADLGQPGSLAKAIESARPDVLVHCAAIAVVDDCEKFPQLAERMNADLPGEAAALCAAKGIQMIHISTDAVFDGKNGPYREEDATNPLSVYARTKLGGELKVLQANGDAMVARINIFGWSLTGKRSLAEIFYNNLSAGMPMQGFTDILFCPLLVNDLSTLLMECAGKKLSGLYHMVASDSLSKYEFGLRVAKRFGLDGNLIAPVSWKDGGLVGSRSADLRISTDKLAARLGKQLPTVDEGLARFYELFNQGYPRVLQAMLASAAA